MCKQKQKTIMANIFNDLNKLVNTVQKVDKLLTEKPKRTRTKSFTKQFTEKELNLLSLSLHYYHSNNYWRMKEDELNVYNLIKNKLK